MKPKNAFLVLMLLAFAAVITSCSTSIEIAKRSFNKGYYVHVVNKNRVVSDNEKFVAQNKNPEITLNEQKSHGISVPDDVKMENNDQELSAGNSFSASKGTEPILIENKKSMLLGSFSDDNLPVKNKKQLKQINTIQKKLNRTANRIFSGSDLPDLLIIILCIFIPPLAVLLVDNIGTPFWLDLIFWILGWGGGLALSPFAFLFWLIAIIYAFTICF